jgi:hypothetical protein
MNNLVDLSEYRRAYQSTTKGGCEHLCVKFENKNGWVAIRFESNGNEKALAGVTCPRETYEKFDRELRAIMGWNNS